MDQGVVYAGIGDEGVRIFALEAQSGKLLWQSTTTISAMAHLLIADGVLYTSERISDRMSVRFNLVGLDPRNGTVIWQHSGVDNVSLLVHSHVLYAASALGDLYAFDTQTRQLLWQQTVRTRAGAVSRMKLLGDELYVGFNGLGEYEDQFVSIHAINTLTGGEDWSATVRWNVGTLDLA